MSNESITKDLAVVDRSRDLQDWVFAATSKKAKEPENQFEENKNNGMPQRYMRCLGERMQDYSLDITCNLLDAKFRPRKRVEYLENSVSALNRLNECIWLCFRRNIIRKAYAEEGERIVKDVKSMTLAWLKKVSQ